MQADRRQTCRFYFGVEQRKFGLNIYCFTTNAVNSMIITKPGNLHKESMKLSPVHVLVVDDDEDDFLILREYLHMIEGQEFVIDWCNSYDEASKKIAASKYQVYFIDYRLGARTGLELIEESIKNNCEEPFILLTGNGNITLDRKAMESGAIDYLVKSELNPEKLERCI